MDKQLILNNIKEHYNFKNDAEFAKYLGIPAQNLSKWKIRKTFDAELIYTKCIDINAEWLLTGNGTMLKSEAIAVPIIQEDTGKTAMLERENAGLLRENAMQAKVIAGLERENQLLREARETNQDKSKPSHTVATSVGSKS
ncbi:hypothetical protein FPG87_02085 [Flavobacterium psychrophilum]|uniref:helix-turn-helix domain-containing protein n=1 Tax=Flavobacterium psychrophilum TaxID=96345 RepID=UPI0009031C77|nr:helix-turn-helix domain-containing protein [Flavobacterium psychrophilum]ELY1979196.1 helix-turn-helix domain-containing protein [Flavobacterium psychrophilum]OJH12451.1 hypothetical protein FPG87_02085 [Flavobacterium psychrophilum]